MSSTHRWSPFQLASPARFYDLTKRWAPVLWATALVCGLAGLWVGFAVAPTDATQGEAYRILFIHVPAAWMSMVLYLAMAGWALVGWAWKSRMASLLARAIAPSGAVWTAIALWTGAIWGQPTWGTWWAWDARMTSELILLFLYLGYMALQQGIEDPIKGDMAGAVLAGIGAINVPVIYMSVKWWNTLHQGATISMTAAPKMAQTMLTALVLCTLACWAYTFATVFARARRLALDRDQDHTWTRAHALPTAKEV